MLVWMIVALSLSQTADGLFEAARNGDTAKLESLLKANPNGKLRDLHGRTALHEAAAYCHLEAATALVRAGWDKEALDEKRWTPLDYALRCPDAKANVPLAVLLMVRPWVTTERVQAPWTLQNAAEHGSISVLEMLLSMGVNVNAAGTDGRRALDIACLKGDAAVAQLLLEHGANPGLRNDAGSTPLHDAALSGNSKVVELLLAHGAEVNAVELKSGSTPLHYAASFRRLEAIQVLVEHGADITRKNAEGLTAAEWAIRSGQPEAAEVLKKK